MCIRDPINKTRCKNGKDLSNEAPNIKLWNHTKKTHFPVFAKNFRRPCMKLKIFFCQFPNPWTLRVSGMVGYTSKCEKKTKSLHPSDHAIQKRPQMSWCPVPLSRYRNVVPLFSARRRHARQIIFNFPRENGERESRIGCEILSTVGNHKRKRSREGGFGPILGVSGMY
jgi:hypothetical protein